MENEPEQMDEEERKRLRKTFNGRISRVLNLVALAICVIAFGSIVLGEENPVNLLMGLCIAVSLLAIASMQDHHHDSDKD